MKCPSCQGEMESGTVNMRMPFLSLNFGLSSKDLYFTGAKGDKHRLLRPEGKLEARRCNACGSVLILTNGSA